jgi:hypothetical protein
MAAWTCHPVAGTVLCAKAFVADRHCSSHRVEVEYIYLSLPEMKGSSEKLRENEKAIEQLVLAIELSHNRTMDI